MWKLWWISCARSTVLRTLDCFFKNHPLIFLRNLVLPPEDAIATWRFAASVIDHPHPVIRCPCSEERIRNAAAKLDKARKVCDACVAHCCPRANAQRR